jgi:phenylacetate-CoA ligase
LRRILTHAYDTCPFWRERVDGCGIAPAAIDSPNAISEIPILTKNDLRLHSERMRSSAIDCSQLIRKTTSGSTGVSLEVLDHETSQQWKRACALRSNEWSGWRLGERIAAVWGNPEYVKHGWRGRLRNALLERFTYLDTLKMDVVAMDQFAETLRR